MSDATRALREIELAAMSASELRAAVHHLAERAEAAESELASVTSQLTTLHSRAFELEAENKVRGEDQVRLDEHIREQADKLERMEMRAVAAENDRNYWQGEAEERAKAGGELADLLDDAWWVKAADCLRVVSRRSTDVPF